MAGEPILRVDDLVVHFSQRAMRRRDGSPPVRAVEGVSLEIGRRETLALVGESGSGKSTVARAIVGMVTPTAGDIHFEGERLGGGLGRHSKAACRGMQMVFQNTRGSLNPRMRVRQCIDEPMRVNGYSRARTQARTEELLGLVGLTRRQAERFPPELSGGQQQRVGIARALALEPRLLVLDEPVSALDVSVQAQILNLFMDLQEQLGLSYLFISHDLAVVAGLADRIAVMYLGKILETGPADAIIGGPVHPYTQALISAVPIDEPRQRGSSKRIMLTGDLPSPTNPPSGCNFRTRCWRATAQCAIDVPPNVAWDAGGTHLHRCLFPAERDTGVYAEPASAATL
jgi:oligopeptide/dipeptide ABC transporter ATP-binding protein